MGNADKGIAELRVCQKKNPQISFVSAFGKSQTAERLLINSLPWSGVQIFLVAT